MQVFSEFLEQYFKLYAVQFKLQNDCIFPSYNNQIKFTFFNVRENGLASRNFIFFRRAIKKITPILFVRSALNL